MGVGSMLTTRRKKGSSIGPRGDVSQGSKSGGMGRNSSFPQLDTMENGIRVLAGKCVLVCIGMLRINVNIAVCSSFAVHDEEG